MLRMHSGIMNEGTDRWVRPPQKSAITARVTLHTSTSNSQKAAAAMC